MNSNRWPFGIGLLVLIAIEVLYIAVTRLLLLYENTGIIELETIRTGVRLASAGLTWWLFRDLLITATSKTAAPQKGFSWNTTLPWIATVLFLSIPVMVGDWNLPEGETRLLFAVTSFPVGLREELVYRGVLLTLLVQRLGFVRGLILSTIAFAMYHYGAQPWTLFTVSQYIAGGLLLGTLFWATRSLWLVIWIHTVYDVIYCYTPLISPPWSKTAGIFTLYIITLIIFAWTYLIRKRLNPASQV